jgi:hypothetical protein
MPLSDMMRDTISLIKQNGERHDNMRASVKGTVVIYMKGEPLFESGDEIVRIASNGGQDRMIVIDPGFHEPSDVFPAHYQMKVQKVGGYQPASASATQVSQVYNFNGDNARVNHNSVDNSSNVVKREEVSLELIAELRQLMAKSDIPEEEREVAADVLDVIERQFESGKPRPFTVTRMLETLPKIAGAGEAVAKLIALCQGAST